MTAKSVVFLNELNRIDTVKSSDTLLVDAASGNLTRQFSMQQLLNRVQDYFNTSLGRQIVVAKVTGDNLDVSYAVTNQTANTVFVLSGTGANTINSLTITLPVPKVDQIEFQLTNSLTALSVGNITFVARDDTGSDIPVYLFTAAGSIDTALRYDMQSNAWFTVSAGDSA